MTCLTFLGTLILALSYLSSVSGTCENCLIGNAHCDQVTGICWYGCKPGWTGNQCTQRCNIAKCVECYTFSNSTEICDKCEYDYYGDNCEKQCSQHCMMGRCNSAGDCIFGCKAHWTGQKCDQRYCNFDFCEECGFSATYYIPICSKCIEGMFYSYEKNNCVNCSSKCIGGQKQCNTSTGVCFHGCVKGIYGTNCDRNCMIPNCDQCVLAYKNSDVAKCGICSEGYYPVNLECFPCSNHCIGSKCNGSTGHCVDSCDFGWFGSRCDKKCTIQNCLKCGETELTEAMYCIDCSPGMYYNYMEESCRNCSKNCIGGRNTCERNTGRCINGCKPGYTGEKCDLLCGHCKDAVCYINGTCVNGCEAGWYTKYCTQQYPEHCADGEDFKKNGTCGDCQAYWYGAVCDKKCSTHCRPSNYNGYVYCDKNNGKCDSGCISGYYGETCTLSCNENCNYGNCDQTTGRCTHGCEYKYYGEYCDKRCPKNCDLPGCNSITGECSKDCVDGYFGVNCSRLCSPGCQNNRCFKVHGACQEGCDNGYYGNECRQKCGENCLDNSCIPYNGECKKGCNAGFYGDFCVHLCKNCVNSTCDQRTGTCLNGCQIGMSGPGCDKVCPSGTYGDGCAFSCSSCRNEVCDPKSGQCNFGCAVGFTGHLCKDEVPLSYARSSGSSEKDNIAIVASSSVSVVLTISVIVVVFIVVCRKKNIHPCTKMKKTERVNSPQVEMQGIEPQQVMEMTIDPADLQLYPVIITNQRFEIKFGKYCSSFRSSPVMVRILPNGSKDKEVEDFYRDVDILKGLSKQKNVVFFLGTGNNKDYSFSVFELCGSGVVLSYLRNITESCRDDTATILKRNMAELLGICLGVINGMNYLVHKKIFHRHIAAVNIFLDDKRNSKIGNFFHAVNVLPETEEVECFQLPEECLPWTAPESVRSNIFSCQSEVYAFGVFLWEIMSMGEDVGVVHSKLTEDELLPRPDGCEGNIYRIMIDCWNCNPYKRPTLKYLFQQLSRQIDEPGVFDDQIRYESNFSLNRSTSV